MSRADLPAPQRTPLGIEQDPQLWWTACQKALRELLTQAPADEIDAIAIDGTSSTLLLSDPEGKPLTPALMYNDSRAREEAALLAKTAPQEAAVHSPSSSLAKLLWFYGHQLYEPLERPHVALHQADWVMGHFCGRYDISDENNGLKLGYDPLTRQWPAWMNSLNLPEDCLPGVVPAGSPVGLLAPDVAAEFGLRADCQVIAGTTDSTASFLATGAEEIGDAVTTLGSTLVLKVLSEQPVFAPQYGVYSHRLGDRWLVGGASNTGGSVLRHFFTDTQLAELSLRINPDIPGTLNYYPLPATGERFPVNDPDKKPMLTPRPDDDADFLQGLFEGIARIEADGYRLLSKLGAPSPRTIRSAGGGAKNITWQQIRAHQLEAPLLNADHTEAACGVAKLARAGLDKIR